MISSWDGSIKLMPKIYIFRYFNPPKKYIMQMACSEFNTFLLTSKQIIIKCFNIIFKILAQGELYSWGSVKNTLGRQINKKVIKMFSPYKNIFI